MEIATAPKMQLFMTFMIVYFFIGNSVSIYSIFAIVQSITSSIGSLLRTNKSNKGDNLAFEPFEERTKSLLKYKIIFMGINSICIGLVAYKLSKMGLLSFSPSAYIDMIPNYQGVEVIATIWMIVDTLINLFFIP